MGFFLRWGGEVNSLKLVKFLACVEECQDFRCHSNSTVDQHRHTDPWVCGHPLHTQHTHAHVWEE